MEIKITVNIGLTAGLESFLTNLVGGQTGAPVKPASQARQVSRDEAAQEQEAIAEMAVPVAEVEQGDAASPQPEPAKRTRRTKEQMAADAAAAATGQSGAQKQTVDLLGGASGPTATTAASPSDLAEALAAEDAGTVTADQAKAVFTAAMGREGSSPKKVQELMIAKIGPHAKSFGALDPTEWPAAVALWQKIVDDGVAAAA